MKPPIPCQSRSAPCQPVAQGDLLISIVMVVLTILILILAQSAEATIGALSLAWIDDTPTDHDGFEIERRNATYGTYALIHTITEPAVTSYTDFDLVAGTTYCYRVRAYKADAFSDYSNETCAIAQSSYNLTVVKTGSGAGTVASSPTGIGCGTTCTAPFLPTDTATLTATPATGSDFTGWSGEGCSGTGNCAVTMSQTRNVTATFTLQTFALNLTRAGTGTGSVTSIPAGINCGSTCSTTLVYPTQVTLTATASAGSAFTGWSGGGCAGTPRCTVAMNQVRNVIATFVLDATAHSLALSFGGSSGGNVGSNPSGITCSSACSASFAGGAPVTLTATADAGGTFRTWRGDCTTSPCSVYIPIDANRAVTAVFSKTFTNDPLAVQSTPIKAVHITELRDAINTLRSRVNPPLSPYVYTTDPIITPGTTTVKAAHLNQMCTALKQAYPAATCATTLTSGQAIQAIHFTNLRSAVRGLE
jgi:Divergent InlB B-repeat domain